MTKKQKSWQLQVIINKVDEQKKLLDGILSDALSLEERVELEAERLTKSEEEKEEIYRKMMKLYRMHTKSRLEAKRLCKHIERQNLKKITLEQAIALVREAKKTLSVVGYNCLDERLT